jgi:hypothetical protein
LISAGSQVELFTCFYNSNVGLELACDTPACFGPLKSPKLDDYEDIEQEHGHSHDKMYLAASERTAVSL